MDKSKKYLAISFIVVLIAVIILSFAGMFSICPFPKIVDMKKIQNSGSTTHTPK
jgi:hypothetical protein